jgi:hypothetical protein
MRVSMHRACSPPACAHRAQAWDPVLIIAQIAALQCLFYLTLGVLQAAMLGACVCVCVTHSVCVCVARARVPCAPPRCMRARAHTLQLVVPRRGFAEAVL